MKTYLFTFIIGIVVLFSSMAQNVGIGISDPNRAKLELNGAVGTTTAIFGGESTGISLQRNWPALGFNQYYNAGGKYIGNGFAAAIALDISNGYLVFDMFPNGTTNGSIPGLNRALTLAHTGKIGIGAVVPNAPLQFVNDIQNRKIVLWETANNDHQYYGFGIEPGALRYAVPSTDNFHRFYCGADANTSRLIAEFSGSNSSASFRVFRGTGIDGTAVFQGSTYHTRFNYSGNEDTYIRGGINGSRVIINDIPNGQVSMGNGSVRVGINTIDPQYAFDIRFTKNSLGFALGGLSYDPNWVLSVPIDLQFSFNGELKAGVDYEDGDWYTLSDIRLKKDIVPQENVLDKVLLLKPIKYRMRNDTSNGDKSIGFAAQDLRKLFPEFVSVVTHTNTGYPDIQDLHMVSYNGLIVIAIKAIQEQQQTICAQQTEIEQLKIEIGNIRQALQVITTDIK